MWSFKQCADFTLVNSLFGAFNLTKNVELDKYKYPGYGAGFSADRSFSLCDGSRFGKKVIIFGADMSSSAHIDNRKKDVLIVGKCPTKRLDNTTLIVEKEYAINFIKQQKKFCLSLLYNRADSYIFANGVENYKFRVKDFEINAAPLCLGKVSEDFSADDMEKTGLYRYVCNLAVDCDSIDVDDILVIHKCLMVKNNVMAH